MEHLYEMKKILIIGIIVFIFLLVFGILIFSNLNSEEETSEEETQDETGLGLETESATEIPEGSGSVEETEDELVDIRTSDDVFNLIDESVELLS